MKTHVNESKHQSKHPIKNFIGKISSSLQNDEVESIVEALKQDHEDLKSFIPTMQSPDSTKKEKRDAFNAFSALLKSHAECEEKALYKPCQKVEDLRLNVEEGFVEHELATVMMKSASRAKDDTKFDAYIKVLGTLVEHHIDEEESEFLPKLDESFDDEEQMKMAQVFIEARRQSQTEIDEDNAGILKDELHA